MPKKPSLSRLENLFVELEQEAIWPPASREQPLSGWSWTCDSQGKYLTCTAEVELILGRPAQEFIGQSIFDFALTAPSAQALQDAFSTAEAEESLPYPVDLEFVAEDGQTAAARFHVTHREPENQGWQGYVQLSPSGQPAAPENSAPFDTSTSTGDDWTAESTQGKKWSNSHTLTRFSPPSEARLERPDSLTLPPDQNLFLPETSTPTVYGSPGAEPAGLPTGIPASTPASIPASIPAENRPHSRRGKPYSPKKTRRSSLNLAAQGPGQDRNKETPAPPETSLAYPENLPPSPAGIKSLQQGVSVIQNSGPDQEAVIAVPVGSGGGGVELLLEIFDESENRSWSQDERQLVEQVADQLAIALENARLFAENLTLARAVEAAPDMILIGSMDRTVQFANPAFEAATGYNGDEAVGKNLAALNGHDPAQPLYQLIQETILSGQTWRGEVSNLRKDGSCYDAQLAVSPIANERGEITQFVAVQRDISESKRAQAEREYLLQETETLYQASASLNAASTYGELLEILREYTILGHPATVDISLNIFDRPWTDSSRPEWLFMLGHWSRGFAPARSSDRIPVSAWLPIPPAFFPDGALFVPDPTSDPRLGGITRALNWDQETAKGLVFAPMMVAGKWIGHIAGIYEEECSFSEAALRRLNSLVGQAAVSIDNIRLLEETRRRNEELAAINAIISAASSSLDLNAMLSEVLERVLAAIRFDSGLVSLADPAKKRLHLAVQRRLPEGLGKHFVDMGLEESLSFLVYRKGEAISLTDLNETGLAEAGQYAKYGLGAYLGVPLRSKGEIMGTLCVFSQQPQEIVSDSLSLLQTVGQQVGVAVENARAFELVQQAVVEMRKVDQLKSQFLANMSHELRTPLNSIIGFSRVILKGIDGPVSDLQRQDLTAIYNSGQHLLNMINEILDLSKIEAGKMELSFDEQVDMAELITAAIATVGGLAKDKPVELLKELPEGLPKVRADPIKIRQVVINLLSNAIKFTESGSVTASAAVEGDPGLEQLIVRVTDTGPGIPAEDQARLFLPFSQLDPVTNRKVGGSGLGLSISKRLVELHGGQIGVKSEPGAGSTFYFSLPLTFRIQD
jgi:PAS domain S-box-containing protein